MSSVLDDSADEQAAGANGVHALADLGENNGLEGGG